MIRHQTLPTSLPAFIWHFARPFATSFIVLMLVPSVLLLEAVVIPYALKSIVDTVTLYDGDRTDIYVALAHGLFLAGGAWLVMITVLRSQEWLEAWFFPRFEANVRMAMYEYTLAHSHNYFASHFAGSLSNKISDMVSALRNLFTNVRWELIATLAVTIAAIVMVGTINANFAFILIGWVAIMAILVVPFAIKANRISTANAEHKSILAGKIVDSFTNIANVRLFARSRFERTYLQSYQDTELNSNRELLIHMAKLKIWIEIIAVIFYVALFYMLIEGWKNGTVTGGDFVFVFYSTFNVIVYIWQASQQLPEIFAQFGVAQQALSIISEPHQITDCENAKELKVDRGEIRFDDVDFRYVPDRNLFLHKNITIRAGEKVGLVGFSGSGKSTFVNLILRLYDVKGGAILIDGQNISGVTQDSLHRSIAMIPQDTSLFHRTLMDNIRYGRPEANDDEVITASQKANCHDFIDQIPERYDALVGERGVKLSGGQRQRIAFARAILKDAPILILDEATSSLDSQTEKYIQTALEDLMVGRTTIVIAHRLSTLSNMDRLLVFHDGQIVEDGSHDELLATEGHYAQLWRMQAGGFIPNEKQEAV